MSVTFIITCEEDGLAIPDFTVITHWHYNHAFGMYYIHGASIAHEKTNLFLLQQQEKALGPSYMDRLKKEDLLSYLYDLPKD